MGQYDVRISERADRQISAALRWWSTNRLLAPDLLRCEIAHAIGASADGYLLYYRLCRDGWIEVRRLVHGARRDR